METHNQEELLQILRLSAVSPSMPNTNDTKLDHIKTKIQSQPRIPFLLSSLASLLGNKVKKRKFEKSDISNPTNFVHLYHEFDTDQPVSPSNPSGQIALSQNGISRPPARPTPPPVPTIKLRGKVPQLPSSVPPVQKSVTIPAAPPPPPPRPTVTFSTETATIASNTLKPQAEAVPVITDASSALMDSIRNGTVLKKVDKTTPSTQSGTKTLKPKTETGTKNITDALLEVLEKRGDVMRSSDDESSDNECDLEWKV